MDRDNGPARNSWRWYKYVRWRPMLVLCMSGGCAAGNRRQQLHHKPGCMALPRHNPLTQLAIPTHLATQTQVLVHTQPQGHSPLQGMHHNVVTWHSHVAHVGSHALVSRAAGGCRRRAIGASSAPVTRSGAGSLKCAGAQSSTRIMLEPSWALGHVQVEV